MANRDFKDVQALERELKIVAGRVLLTGGSAVASAADGIGFTPTKAGDGDYWIYLDDKYTSLMYANATVTASAPDECFAYVVSHDVSGATPSVRFKFTDDDGNAQAFADGDEFSFFILLKNSSVT
jgi:hypothetical protein